MSWSSIRFRNAESACQYHQRQSPLDGLQLDDRVGVVEPLEQGVGLGKLLREVAEVGRRRRESAPRRVRSSATGAPSFSA